MAEANATAPTLADIEEIARAELRSIPAPLRRHVGDVVIRVEDFCDAEIEREMGLDSPFDLLGLYQGVSLGQKSVSGIVQDLDRIFLYRRPMLDYWCESGEPLRSIVRHVLIHEIGHHFGFSDDDMDRIEQSA
jgi:predicted Zn-dependent protease with MMP-like domain